jgi:tRNA(Ile)-lysidine synthetase-like protein
MLSIKAEYADLYNTWISHPEWWFNATPEDDLEISDRFGHLLDDRQWQNTEFAEKDIEYWIGVLICNDQVVKHVNRVVSDKRPIADVVTICYTILNTLVPHSRHLSSKGMVFVLLPLRHTRLPVHVFHAIECAFQYLDDLPGDTFMKRFIKASFDRIDHNSQMKVFIPDVDHIVDMAKFSDVLHDTVDVVGRESDDMGVDCESLNDVNVFVSLSGGVDSMSCLHFMKNLPHVYAVHINYMNRSETEQEERFVVEWCNKHNITCFVRRIWEIRRDDCMKHGMRDMYEKYTQDVRFATYRFATKCINNDLDSVVVLGHNKDDAFENIVTNIQSKSKFDNLIGMECSSFISGIYIIRPLLMTEKSVILSYAKKYGIPYLKDTTPSWSRRAKIRRELHAHDWLVDGMFDVAEELSNATFAIDYFVDISMESFINGSFSCDIDHPVLTSIMFASKFFKKAFPSYIVSRKSIINFIEKVQHLMSRGGTQHVILNKNLKIKINSHNCVVSLFIV